MSKTLITSDDPKGRHIMGLVRAVLDKAKLDDGPEGGAQRIIEQGGEFQAGLRDLIAKFRFSNQFADEEVASTFCYPREYAGRKAIQVQVDMLAAAFGLSIGLTMEFIDKVLPGLSLPEGAEGWFAIPSVEAIAKRHFAGITDPAEQYCRALKMIIEKLAGTRKARNYREVELTTRHIRQHPRTLHAIGLIAEQQQGDILVIPAQFGMRHRGRSVRRGREVFKANEFGLGGFAVGCMTLTHPERFVRWEQLHADCPGDEYDFEAKGAWGGAPIWDFSDGKLRFSAGDVDFPDEYCGSVSGFVPESQF